LTQAWRRFQLDFTATADDENARLHFDAGNSDIPVELSFVILRSRPGGTPIAPSRSHGQYYVRYQFNSLGCRGRDYEIPRPAGTGRILLLGDSFTQGIGVHQADTFASQLERLLNEKNRAPTSFGSYEVVNCGVSGFGTREERLFYEEVGERYQPQVVLLVMMTNDDMSFLEEIEKGYALRHPGRLESLSYVWRQIQEYRHRRPFPDYRGCVRELSWLRKSVRDHGARLGVIIFRSNRDYGGDETAEMWDELTNSVTAALRGTDVPLLDLGPALVARHPGEDLLVHDIDGHPNDVAHHTAAQVIFEFLLNQGLLRRR
jgi:GDSL-like lipase/acylhydrolase family protein